MHLWRGWGEMRVGEGGRGWVDERGLRWSERRWRGWGEEKGGISY